MILFRDLSSVISLAWNDVEAANTLDQQDRMLLAYNVTLDIIVESARDTWSTATCLPCPIDTEIVVNALGTLPRWPATVQFIWKGGTCKMDRSSLLAFRVSHSSDLLYALPITSCDLYVLPTRPSASQSICAWDWLGETHPCPCGTTVTTWGTHGLSCKRSTGRSTRRHQINHAILKSS